MANKKKKTKIKRKAVVRKKPTKFRLSKDEFLPLAGVLGITFLCFIPALSADFVNWDDDYNILNNENLNAFRWKDIVGIFTSHVIGNYNPLTILTFAIEKAIFGLKPGIFHFNNIALHLGCTYFVYVIFRRLKLPMIAALIGALLFGIHPMRVESVAWITERKDVLFGIFYLASIVQYLKYLEFGRKQKKFFYYALGLAVFALLAKIQAVVLPLSMLAIDYLKNRELKWSLVIEKIPFFALSFIMGLVGIYFLGEQGSIGANKANYHFGERIVIGAYSYGVYLVKFIFPYKMLPLYPYPSQIPGHFYTGFLSVIATLGALIWAFRKNYRPIVFGIAFFTFNVMFVLQVVGAGQGFLADRFTYIPFIGLFFIVAYYWNSLIDQNKKLRTPLMAGMGAYLLLFAVMTFNQTGIWQNSGKLWTKTLEEYDNAPLPYRNRGNYYRDIGNIEAALKDYSSGLAIEEDDGVHNSRAKLYFGQGKYRLALKDYNRAIELNDQQGEYFINRGATKAALGNYQNALKDVNIGLELSPQMSSGYLNRSLLYSTLGQPAAAIKDIETYLTIEPNHAELWYELGKLRREAGTLAPAMTAVNRAIQLNPNQGLFYLERSKIYFSQGNRANAKQDMQQAERMGVQIEAEYKRNFN